MLDKSDLINCSTNQFSLNVQHRFIDAISSKVSINSLLIEPSCARKSNFSGFKNKQKELETITYEV